MTKSDALTDAERARARSLLKKIQDAAIETINYHPNSQYVVEPIVTYARELRTLLKIDA